MERPKAHHLLVFSSILLLMQADYLVKCLKNHHGIKVWSKQCIMLCYVKVLEEK